MSNTALAQRGSERHSLLHTEHDAGRLVALGRNSWSHAIGLRTPWRANGTALHSHDCPPQARIDGYGEVCDP